jgi:MoaA/NifB/PqqE/SkfB family radical SAM enzyme
MSVELFSWLLEELGPTLFEVELHNWGEPLLGRNVFRFIEIARAAGVSATISSNMSLDLDDNQIDRLVECGLSVLGASIDGASQESYEKYRVRGNLGRALDNCRRLAAAKRRLGSTTPELFFSYHVFEHNAHEVEEARRIAEDIGMNFVASRAWVVGDESEGLEQYPYIWGEGFPNRCHFLWFQAVVHHDGGVAPCCGTFYAEDDFDNVPLGELGRKSFRDIWNGDRFISARRLFTERKGDEQTRRLACFDCPETVDFERWKEAIRNQSRDFQRTSSNEMYNFFLNRRPEAGPGLVRLRNRGSLS